MTGNTHPLLNETGNRLLSGQRYLRLFHGRRNPDEDMADWGFNGPTFGPLTSVTITYLATIRIYGLRSADELWLDTMQDMVRWQGDFYGDFEIFVAGPSDTA